MDEQAGSGVTVDAFCAGRDIGLSSFYRWRRKLNESLPASCGPGGFVRLESGADDFRALESAGADVAVAHLGHAVRIVCPGWRLAELVAAVREGVR